MWKKLDRVGEKYISLQGYEMEIIEYFGANNSTIRFNDERGTIRKNVAFKEIKNGNVNNPYHKTTLGIGYVGEGKYKPKVNGKMSRQYRVWDAMMRRCYEPVTKRNSTYYDVSVCEEWHNFQNFAEWFDQNYVEGWYMDKDILCYECRKYSPETCCFVPNEVNTVFKKNNQSTYNLPKGVYPKDGKYQSSIQMFGKQCYLGFFDTIEEAHEVYCTRKKMYLKEVADKWKGKIDDRVYKGILNFDISNL